MATAATQMPSELPSASQLPSRSASGNLGTGSEGRKISTADIQLVQNLIERCLQLYMSQREVVYTLNQQAKIEPGFTLLVWQKLEEQNPDFFRAYYTRLKLKDQIVLFNHLLEQQVQMFHKVQQGWLQPPGLATMASQPGVQLPGAPALRPGGSNAPPQAAGSSQKASPLVHPSSAAELRAPGSPHLPAQVKLEPMPLDDPRQGQAFQRTSVNAEVTGLSDSEFASMAVSLGELHDATPGLGTQSLPFSASEVNLASIAAWSSPQRGGLGTVDTGDLTGFPRNFSLSDLALDQLGSDSEHGLNSMLQHDLPHELPRNFSMSELGHLDGDHPMDGDPPPD